MMTHWSWTETRGAWVAAAVLALAALRFLLPAVWFNRPAPECEVYWNEDASWHVLFLLTENALDRTPMKKHRLLPLVSLGEILDKLLSLGAAVPDRFGRGNDYYPSFPPLTFAIPYLVLKTLQKNDCARRA